MELRHSLKRGRGSVRGNPLWLPIFRAAIENRSRKSCWFRSSGSQISARLVTLRVPLPVVNIAVDYDEGKDGNDEEERKSEDELPFLNIIEAPVAGSHLAQDDEDDQDRK